MEKGGWWGGYFRQKEVYVYRFEQKAKCDLFEAMKKNTVVQLQGMHPWR